MKRIIIGLIGFILFSCGWSAYAGMYALGTQSILVGPSTGSGSVVLAVTPDTTAWSATANAGWLHLSTGYQSGTGSTNVVFGFEANAGATRTGTITIGDQTLTVTQAGSTYLLTSTLVPLVSTGLSQPHGVAVDGSGNVYIADSGNQAIKKWTRTNNTVITLLSSGLSNPYSVAVDRTGNVYIADSGNNTVSEWSATNGMVVSLIASNLYAPSGVALDSAGNVYIADGHDDLIYEWLAASSNLVTLNSLQPPYLCSAPSIAVDLAGNVYFDDTCNDVINEWVAIDTNVVTFPARGFYLPAGIAVDGSGNVYVADQADNWIWQVSAANNALSVVVSGLNRPDGVAVDAAGNPYIADTQNNRVEELVNVYVDPSTRWEGLAAGTDALPPTLPVPPNLSGLSAPTSDSPWLTITGVTNGVVSFSFTAATATRTGTISWFGQKFPVTQRAPSQSLGISSLVVGPGSGTNSVILSVYPFSTSWTATANASWLHLGGSNQNGTGCEIIVFSVDANPGATRSGTITIAGQMLTVTQAASTYVTAGPPTTLVSGIISASGVAVDTAGNVYVTEADQEVVQKWTASNNTVSTAVSSGLDYPFGIVIDGAGNVYIGNQDDATIKKENGTSAITVANGVGFPSAFGVDSTGNLYFGNGAIMQWTAANGVVSTFASSGISSPTAVTVDAAADTVYFVGNGMLQKWTAQNNAVTPLASLSFSSQNGLALDGQGNLYVEGRNSYYETAYLMKWTAANNTLTTLLSSGEAWYWGVAVDASGNLYYTDAYDGLLRELPNAFVDPSPKFEGLAAGSDFLPPVLPATQNLGAPFAPSSDSSWLTISSVANGVVSYSFSENLGLTRTGHISLLGYTVAVTQNGPAFSLGTSALVEGPFAGTDSVGVAVVPNIGVWTATTNVPWLHLAPGYLSGTGSTNIVFSFDANPGAVRTGTVTIAGQTLTVTQSGSTYVQAGTLTTLGSTGLSGPTGVAADNAGNVYIADTMDNSIKEWTRSNNTIMTLVSSGLSSPAGVAVDAAGNVYIADSGNSAIKKWNPTNALVTTLISSGLANPTGVAVDEAGNLYIADTASGAIKEWSEANGQVTTLISSGLLNPAGVAVDVAGNVYIADTANNAIKEWTAANNHVTSLVASGLNNPSGVAVDGGGNLYIADRGNGAIKKWTMASNAVVTLVGSGLSNPSGLAVDVLGNLFIADTGDNALKELPRAFVDSTGRLATADAGFGTLLAVLPTTEDLLPPFSPTSDQSWLTIVGITNGVVSFSYPANFGSGRTAHLSLLGQSITITQDGLAYTLGATGFLVGPAAGSNSVVLAVAPQTASWTATANSSWLHLSPPYQGGIGSTNVIFSYDANTNATRMGTLTVAGQTLTITQAGSTYGPAGSVAALVSSGLSNPFGVAVDGAGNVYIADTYNNAIKVWTPANNNVTTLVSSGLNHPYSVAVDGAGNVYIADTYNGALKEWSVNSSNVITLVSTGLSFPTSIAIDAAGNVYIADPFGGGIKEWSPANNDLTTLVSSGLNDPYGLAVDVAGNVYIADTYDNAIKEWMPANRTLTTLAYSGLGTPHGVAVDGAGNVYIADTSHNLIKKLNAANNTIATLISSSLSSPASVAVDSSGNIYLSDTSHNAIKELPYAFVDSTAKLEGLATGTDTLPVVLPTTINLNAPFTPSSDQPWLTIGNTDNGVVSFTFTADTGPARTAHLSLLGQTVSITQGLIGSPPDLSGISMLSNGIIQFAFTNNPSGSFTVLSTTNLSLPLADWTVVGPATNSSSNFFQFTSQPTSNNQQRFYAVRSP